MRIGTIIKVICALLVAVVLAGVAILSSLDLNQYKEFMQAQAEKRLGRALTLEGDVSLSLGWVPSLVVQQVTLANAPWGSDPYLASVGRLEAQIDLIAALRGQIEIKRFVLVKPEFFLEVRKDGTGNWQGKPVERDQVASERESVPSGVSSSKTAAVPKMLTIESVLIEDGQVIYRAEGQNPLSLKLKTASLSMPDPRGGLMFVVSGVYNGVGFDLKGQAGSLSALLAAQEPYPFGVQGRFGDVTFKADGSVASSKGGMILDAAVTANADRFDEIGTLIALPSLPPLAFSGRVSGGGNRFILENAQISVGKNQVSGQLKASFSGKRPRIEAVLRSPLIDLAGLLPEGKVPPEGRGPESSMGPTTGEGGKVTVSDSRVFSPDPLPWDLLKQADVSADVQIGTLFFPNGLRMAGVALKGTLAEGRLPGASLVAQVGDGTVTLMADLDASSGTKASLKVDAVADHVVVGNVLRQLGREGLVDDVPADMKLLVSARGASVAGLMKTLDGSLLVKMGEGRLYNKLIDWLGADILTQLVDQLNVNRDPNTQLTCGVMNLKFRQGRVSWDRQIAFQTTKMNLVSSGAADLGEERLDVMVRPSPRDGRGLSVGKLAELVRVMGTFRRPELTLDREGVARNVLDIVGIVAKGDLSRLGEALLSPSSGDMTPCATAMLDAPPPVGRGNPVPDISSGLPEIPVKPEKVLREGLKSLFR